MFRTLEFGGFPPFGKCRLELPPVENRPQDLAEVHLFTGVNGTGKTRLLTVLAAMLGNPEPLLQRLKGMGRRVRFAASERLARPGEPVLGATFEAEATGRFHRLDSSFGSNIAKWAAEVPAFAYCGTAYVSDAPITAMAALPKPGRNSCLAFVRPVGDSKGLLQAITNLKLQAAMDSLNEGPSGDAPKRSVRLLSSLESTLAKITGIRFSFQLTTYPSVSLGVNWGGASLPFDMLPDGLRSLIGWLVHSVVMLDVSLEGRSDPRDTEAVFLLDEIESHLHPAWQRRILPAFQGLFPKSQIFVATHSPFVIASLNHGWIHPLILAEDGQVGCGDTRSASQGDSYVSVLEDIMGIKEWYDPETEQLLASFREARDAAYRGEAAALNRAQELARQIGARSMELDYLMGRELGQMDRQLATTQPAT